MQNSQILYRKHLLNKLSFYDNTVEKMRLNAELSVDEFFSQRVFDEHLILSDVTKTGFILLCGCQNTKEYFTWEEYEQQCTR